MRITQNESLALRGLAILAIVLHNYCHFLPGIARENEYTWSAAHCDQLLGAFIAPDASLPIHLLSFFGHYGVPVFLLLSGYGLVMKYEKSGLQVSLPRFLRYNYLKLLRILVPGFVFFIFVDQLTPHPFHYRLSSLLGVLGMWGNLLSDPSHNIWPGPYWYFGLTLQLYIVYRLLFFRWRTAWLPVGSVLICWALQVWSADDSEWLEYLRYNFVGGMLPFTLGVLMARLWPEKTISNGGWWSVLTVSALLAVLLGFCFHGWLWVQLFVAAAAVALVKLLPDDALRPLIWTGSISAALFVVHPALRKLIIGHYARYDIEAGLLLYIVSAIAVAWLFSLIINRIPRPKL